MPNDPRPGTGRSAEAPRLSPISDAAAAYRLVYHRVDALLRGRAEVAELMVPACPGWTVRQTVAHLAGGAQDVASLNLEGVGCESWTQAQVDRLGHNSIEELLDLWGQAIDPVTAMLHQGVPESSAGQLVFDALTHEHDIRGALGEPGSRTEDPAFTVAAGFLTTAYDQAIRQSGQPAFRLITPTLGSLQIGDPATTPDHVTLDISDYEMLRAFGGRRSHGQLSALPWHGDPPNPPPAARNHAIRPPNDDLVE